jgi:hypothetical protein
VTGIEVKTAETVGAEDFRGLRHLRQSRSEGLLPAPANLLNDPIIMLVSMFSGFD